MKKNTLIVSLLFLVSIGLTCAQTTPIVNAAYSGNNDSEYTVIQLPALPGATPAELTAKASVPGKLTMTASPNPFTNLTVITCTLPEKGKLVLGIRDMFGETVKTIEVAVEEAGAKSIEVTSENLRPGIYTAMLAFKTVDNLMINVVRIVYTK